MQNNEQTPGSDNRILIAGVRDCNRRTPSGLGIPNDPRFWPKGQTPAQQLRSTLSMPAEGEGEG